MLSGERKFIDNRLDALNQSKIDLRIAKDDAIANIPYSTAYRESIVEEIEKKYILDLEAIDLSITLIKRNSNLVILDRDIFGDIEYSLSRRRTSDSGSRIENLGDEDPVGTKGPKTVFGNYLNKNTSKLYDDNNSDNTIFLERRFREYVMKWLSDGKPKLYRSETEGNMIVMVSGVSFNPV
jgi:hypothetical protein